MFTYRLFECFYSTRMSLFLLCSYKEENLTEKEESTIPSRPLATTGLGTFSHFGHFGTTAEISVC